MRILSVGNLYPPHSLGGYEVMWQSWVRYARRRGEDVRVLATDYVHDAPGAGSEVDPEPVHRELHWYWHEHRFPRYAPWTRLAIERHNAAILERHLAEQQPDVVVWWNMAGMSMALIERVRRAGIPAVAVVADYWIEFGPKVDGWMRMFRRHPHLGRLVERRTGAITSFDFSGAMSAVFASERVRRGAAAVSESFAHSPVALHGPDLELFQPVEAAPWSWRLLCLGRVDPEKGTDLAIRALEHLPEQATLSVVGGGNESYLAELVELVGRLGLSDRVSFDRLPHGEAARAYAEANVVVFPVRWPEPWGLVPVEAMAVGRPIVASGRGGSSEYLRDAENCLLFNPDDGARELAERVRRLAGDEALRARLIAGGSRTVAELGDADFDAQVQAAIDSVEGEPT